MGGNALDMYRKVAPDLMLATNRGGFFSIVAIGFMAYLGLMETWAFLGTGPVSERIDVELGLSPLRINVDLEFPRLRCEDATVELYRGKTRSTIRGLEQTLRVQRFDDKTKRRSPYAKVADAARAAPVDAGLAGCKLTGFIPYEHTSPGTVAVSAPAGKDLSHTVVDFTFGMPLTRDHKNALRALPDRYRKVVEPGLDNKKYESPSSDKVFHHFVHVVPTKYKLQGRKPFTAHQLLHQSHLSHHDAASDTSAARFGFDISPMVAKVSNRSTKRWYDFVTSMLAVMGGAFTVVSLLERGASQFWGG